MPQFAPEATPLKILYVLTIRNWDGPPGFHVGICRENQVARRIHDYKLKLLKRQLRRPFKRIKDFGDVHIVNGTTAELLQLRKDFNRGRTTCPACGQDLRSQDYAINSDARQCWCTRAACFEA